MKKTLLLLLILTFCVTNIFTQSVAQKRAATMKLGMNVSYLDGWWNGSKDKHFSDFAKPEEAAKREKMFADVAKAGFKTVRIPICFSAWMQLKQPYNWDTPKGLEMADNFVKWALANNLNVLIDLHHLEFDRSIPEAETVPVTKSTTFSEEGSACVGAPIGSRSFGPNAGIVQIFTGKAYT